MSSVLKENNADYQRALEIIAADKEARFSSISISIAQDLVADKKLFAYSWEDLSFFQLEITLLRLKKSRGEV